MFILFDISFKIYLVGFSFFDELNNKIDFVFGAIIFIFWFFWLIYASLSEFELDDAIETIFYIAWCIWQYKRMITLFKEAATLKQKDEELKVDFVRFDDDIDYENNQEEMNNVERNTMSPKLKWDYESMSNHIIEEMT